MKCPETSLCGALWQCGGLKCPHGAVQSRPTLITSPIATASPAVYAAVLLLLVLLRGQCDLDMRHEGGGHERLFQHVMAGTGVEMSSNAMTFAVAIWVVRGHWNRQFLRICYRMVARPV